MNQQHSDEPMDGSSERDVEVSAIAGSDDVRVHGMNVAEVMAQLEKDHDNHVERVSTQSSVTAPAS